MDIWVVSTFWLLWIMPLWIIGEEYLFKSLFSVLLGIYLEVGLLAHSVILCVAFWALNFSTEAAFYISTSKGSKLPHLCQYLFSISFDIRYPGGYEVNLSLCELI